MLKILKEKELVVLDNPLTIEEMKKQMEENNIVEGIIVINSSDMIDNDFESFLDILSEELTGNPCLMDINYSVVAADEDGIYIKITGDASTIIELESDED